MTLRETVNEILSNGDSVVTALLLEQPMPLELWETELSEEFGGANLPSGIVIYTDYLIIVNREYDGKEWLEAYHRNPPN